MGIAGIGQAVPRIGLNHMFVHHANNAVYVLLNNATNPSTWRQNKIALGDIMLMIGSHAEGLTFREGGAAGQKTGFRVGTRDTWQSRFLKFPETHPIDSFALFTGEIAGYSP